MDLSLHDRLGYRQLFGAVLFFGSSARELPVSTGESRAAKQPLALRTPASGWGCFARAFDFGGQVTKGVWGMSWHQEASKGVEDCDKHGVAVKQAMIPGYPN